MGAAAVPLATTVAGAVLSRAMAPKQGGGGGVGGAGMPPPPINLQTTGYGGMGLNPQPQTFTPQAQPPWMTGAFAAPWWGTSAATGQPLTQAMLQPRPTPGMQTPGPQAMPMLPQQAPSQPRVTLADILAAFSNQV